ncbi:membrane protein [Zafaria cholistanensis]|uniref:Membrane protein n=1 Tax=Zafaria cholistanensis TaxID=1682741 RepID=A0A5A7NSX2_9MICC|nr:DMT family transporter [Zafaria cholistanensis]GER23890.1 membrane protein [Zafaria cholistanensis]
MNKQIGLLQTASLLQRLGLVLAAAAFISAWGSGFLVAKIGTVDVPFLTLLVWRFLPLAVVLLAVSAARGDFRRLDLRGLRRQAGIGLLGQFGYCVSVYAAIALGVASGTTALIDAVQPIVVATLVGPVLGLRVRGAQWLGLAVGTVGAVMVVSSQAADVDTGVTAYLLPLLAMAFLIVGTFVDRRWPSTLPVLTTLTVHVGVTAAALLAVSLLTGTFWPPFEAGFWMAAVFAAAVPTVVGYGLYWWLLRRVGVTVLNALLFLVAPATAVAGTALFDEPLTGVTLAGFALCAAGVALVLLSEHRAGPSASPQASLTEGPARTNRAGNQAVLAEQEAFTGRDGRH